MKLREFLNVLEPTTRVQIAMVTAAQGVRAVTEGLSLTSVLIFMATLSKPDSTVIEGPLGWQLALPSDPDARLSFIAWCGLAVALLYLFNTGLTVLLVWWRARLAWEQENRLACRMLANYLRMPYAWFLGVNTERLRKEVVANSVSHGILIPLMSLTDAVLMSALVAATVVAVDPEVSAVMLLVVGGSYGLLYLATKRFLSKAGQENHRTTRDRFQIVGEAFQAIKPVKVLNREHDFLERFSHASAEKMHWARKFWIVSSLPRHFFESVTFVGLIGLGVALLLSGRGTDVLPLLSVYAMAGYRIIPAIHSTFASRALIANHWPALEECLAILQSQELEPEPQVEPLPVRTSIALRDVSFTYPDRPQPALESIELELMKGASLGIVGSTGAGKTTLVDLLLGLLEASKGSLEIDGDPLSATEVRRWQRSVGYVPQDTYLVDASLAANIALGLKPSAIDQVSVERAARAARIHQFVEDELPEGYNTIVGERGIRLSGGQRQRVGIARALYHNPEVLIFDEATSSLDGVTERELLSAVADLAGEKTLVMIAHRLTSVIHCDTICVLEEGRIVKRGSFQELVQESEIFRELVKSSQLPG